MMTDLAESFKTEKPYKLILKLAPPIMLAQLIQALYNIIDSLFIGRYSASGLTALSIIYPIQLLMIAQKEKSRINGEKPKILDKISK